MCNNKHCGRGALVKNASRCLNRRKDNIDETPLRLVRPKSPFERWIFRREMTIIHGGRKSKKKNKWAVLNFVPGNWKKNIVFWNPDPCGLFFLFLLFLPRCQTVNFCLKFHLAKEDFGQTSLKVASFVSSFSRLMHPLAFFVRVSLPRRLLLYTTKLIFSMGIRETMLAKSLLDPPPSPSSVRFINSERITRGRLTIWSPCSDCKRWVAWRIVAWNCGPWPYRHFSFSEHPCDPVAFWRMPSSHHPGRGNPRTCCHRLPSCPGVVPKTREFRWWSKPPPKISVSNFLFVVSFIANL